MPAGRVLAQPTHQVLAVLVGVAGGDGTKGLRFAEVFDQLLAGLPEIGFRAGLHVGPAGDVLVNERPERHGFGLRLRFAPWHQPDRRQLVV